MADNKELKPKSFRINDETAERFKQIAITIGGNQQETLAKLIEAYEFQSGKVILAEKKSDIEQFEKYVTALTRMYMGSLEDNQSITETVRTEFDALLKSKDTTIQDLQEKLTVAKQIEKEATTKAKNYMEENIRLNNYIDSLKKESATRLEDMEIMLADKDKLNKALIDSGNDLKTKMNGMQEAMKQVEELKRELEVFKADSIELKKQLEQEQFNSAKAILELEKSYTEQIQKIKVSKQSELEKYQKKYMDLWEKTKVKMETAEKSKKQQKNSIN